MKSYFLTEKLLNELLYGSTIKKEKIVLYLENLLEKNSSFFISITTLNRILEREIHFEKRKYIYNNIIQLCEKILPLDKEDLPILIGFESEFAIDHFTATEFLIAKKNNVDYILDISERFNFQKMISVISLISKGE